MYLCDRVYVYIYPPIVRWNNYVYNKKRIKLIMTSLTRMKHLSRKRRPRVEKYLIKSCKDKKNSNYYLSLGFTFYGAKSYWMYFMQ